MAHIANANPCHQRTHVYRRYVAAKRASNDQTEIATRKREYLPCVICCIPYHCSYELALQHALCIIGTDSITGVTVKTDVQNRYDMCYLW